MVVSICGLFNYGYLYLKVSAENVVVGVYLPHSYIEVESYHKVEGYKCVPAFVTIFI